MPTDAKIRITAEDKTKRAFQSVNRSLNGFEKGATRVLSRISPLVGVAGATGLGALVRTSVSAADAIGKTADKLGITTDALQEYRFAAELTGVSQSALDVGLQRFSRRLAEADKGSGELSKTLNELNISTRDGNGNIRSAEDVLSDYADAIQRAESDQEKLRLAFKAFDTEGAAMVNTLRNGSQGLADLRKEARDSGVVMDESIIRKAEVANDRWSTLTATIGTKFKSALISVLDVFVDLRDTEERLSDLNAEMEKTASNIRRIAEAGKSTGLGPLAIKELEAETEALREMRLEHEKLTKQLARENEKESDGNGSSSGSGSSKTAAVAASVVQPVGLEADTDRKLLAEKFFRLDESLRSEQERLRLSFQEKEFIIEEAFQVGLSTDSERKNQLLDLEARFQAELTMISERGLSDREKFEKKSGREKLKTRLSLMTQMTQGVATNSKAAFKLNKALALANTAVSLRDAVIQTYRNNGGYPWGIAPAALMAATGAAQIAAINSTSFGGGGGSRASVASGGAASVPSRIGSGVDSVVSTVPQELQSSRSEPTRIVSVNIGEGAFLPASAVRSLIERIQEVAEDMGANTKIVLS